MKTKGMRLVDLMAHFSGVGSGDGDQGSDGSMTTTDLKKGLRKICAPSPQLQAMVKRKAEAALEKKMLDDAREFEEKKLNDQLKVLEESGTARIMRSIHEIMREKGKTLGQVFNEIDKTGDGVIERGELKGGLEMLTAASDVSKFAVQRELQKKAAEKAETEKHEKIRKEFFDKMAKAKESGVTDVMDKIGGIMRKRQLRIKDLISLKNAGSKSKFGRKGKRRGCGDGDESPKKAEVSPKAADGLVEEINQTITPQDLMNLLKRVDRKLDITIEECVLVCSWIDKDGGGTLSMDELERAICAYRRYLWEKEQVAKLQRSKQMKVSIVLCVL